MEIFGVKITSSPNKVRKVVEWQYEINGAGFYSDSLEGAVIHIIAVKNNRASMTQAAAFLLGVNK